MRSWLLPTLACLVAVGCSARTGTSAEGECVEHLIMPTPEHLAERGNETAEWYRLNERYDLRRRPVLPQWDKWSERVGYLRPGDRAPVLAHSTGNWVRVRSPSTGATGWIQSSSPRASTWSFIAGTRDIRYLNTKTLEPCEPPAGNEEEAGGVASESNHSP